MGDSSRACTLTPHKQSSLHYLLDGTREGTPTMLGSIMSPEQDLFVVASPLGSMVLYENDPPSKVEVFGVPLRCVE